MEEKRAEIRARVDAERKRSEYYALFEENSLIFQSSYVETRFIVSKKNLDSEFTWDVV